MKKLDAIFGPDKMFYCSVPVPPINAHKDPDYTFDFTPEQIAGYGQSQTHPSIIYISDGWNGHKYWLATTPYPHAMDVFENPCIYYGDEDENGNPPRIFTPINGVVSGDYIMIDNPVVKVPNNTNVNSDPDLYFDESPNIMYLFSRFNQANPMRGYFQKSISGQAWTKRDNSNYIDSNGQPSLMKVGDKVLIFGLYTANNAYDPDAGYVQASSRSLFKIKKGDVSDIQSFQDDGCAVMHGKISIGSYHADFFKDDLTGKYYLIAVATNIEAPNQSSYRLGNIYLAESEDGYNWHYFARPLLTSCDMAKAYYRPTACIRQSDRSLIVYWCTTSGIQNSPEYYPNGQSDVPVDGRTIGLSYGNFDAILAKLKDDEVTNVF